MRFKHVFVAFGLFCSCSIAFAQDDLLSLIPEEKTRDYASASFKTTRVVNGHSVENPAAGVLDFKISHRFNYLKGGFYDIFGLDGATMRIGLDYGINDRLCIGWGRSTLQKAYDGYVKYKLVRQQTGLKNVPVSVSWVSTMAVNTLRWDNLDRVNYFTSRLYYTHHLIIARKFSESTSLQLMPTMVHRNIVSTLAEKNDVYSIGIAGRQKITKRIALNAEYFYNFPNQLDPIYVNPLALCVDIETGAHVVRSWQWCDGPPHTLNRKADRSSAAALNTR